MATTIGPLRGALKPPAPARSVPKTDKVAAGTPVIVRVSGPALITATA
ncbi:hypothetical protein [Nonomuraea sp. NPDC049400]